VPGTSLPPGKVAFRHTPDGPMPLLVPEAMVVHMRERFPAIWVEPIPDMPLTGRPITLAESKDAAR